MSDGALRELKAYARALESDLAVAQRERDIAIEQRDNILRRALRERAALSSEDATRPTPASDQATLRTLLTVDQQTESSTSGAVTSRSLRPTGDKE